MVGLHQILAGKAITCLEPLRTKLSIRFKFLKKIYILLRCRSNCKLTSKKVQKQDLEKKKTLKMQKNVGMACQKVSQQGRDDIIVKVNLQSPIPTSQ